MLPFPHLSLFLSLSFSLSLSLPPKDEGWRERERMERGKERFRVVFQTDSVPWSMVGKLFQEEGRKKEEGGKRKKEEREIYIFKIKPTLLSLLI